MNILASAFLCSRISVQSGLAGAMGICIKISICCCCLVATLCLFCNPMDCSRQAPLCPWGFPSKNTGVGSHSLLQRSFRPRDPTWVSCRQTLSRLSQQGTETQKFTDFPTWWVNDRVAMCLLMRRTPGRTRQSWTLFSTLSPRAHLVISGPWDITRLAFFSLLSLRLLRGS